ncbi:3-oxoacyl-[acyl-carrier-protein] reductase FabG-like [Epargyreus clarus]|uniref:3-oxoacyl-[acyl-carrier-protein] reductase FabG-like n=1 Tax=Epargyreus clarus TaxID=520877 RepID=UPI003C2DB9A8
MDFTDKVVIITGGSSGIGAASAVLFAKQGAKLALVGRNTFRLQQVADKCQAARGVEPLCLKLDLTEPDSCAAVVTRAVAMFGRIDVLVNCAGKLQIGSLFDDSMDVFDETLNLNLRVPYKLTQLVLPYLAKTKGNVVNVLGANYVRVRHGFLPYCIAKAGLDKFTKMAAVELATAGVRVNSVQCGISKTNILSNIVDKDLMDHEYKILEQDFKFIEPEEVSKMVVFVASGVCPNLNGADLGIHGASVLA